MHCGRTGWPHPLSLLLLQIRLYLVFLLRAWALEMGQGACLLVWALGTGQRAGVLAKARPILLSLLRQLLLWPEGLADLAAAPMTVRMADWRR